MAAFAFAAWEYGRHVSRSGLSELKITAVPSMHPTNVTIDGTLLGGALAVSSVKQHRNGHCIIVVVRAALVRPGRKWGKFHLNVAVSDDIEAIAFGNSSDVIWHR